MRVIANPFRHSTHQIALPPETPFPSDDLTAAARLLARCPSAAATPLLQGDRLASVAEVHIKDERGRMGLGSFKALGAAYVIACDADAGLAKGRTYVTASAGNHGLSVATGAQVFGAAAVIYIAESVPESFAERLRQTGAEVRREGNIYEDSMAAAQRAAEVNGWQLLSDSSWDGYYDPPHRLMEGYLALMAEVFEQMPDAPTHIFLQAGVGGLAGACAAAARKEWGDAPVITVVEPEAAPALIASIEAGCPVLSEGPVSNMGRLDCKEPSFIALKGLARDADWFCTISEDEAAAQTEKLRDAGFATSPSGGAGLVAMMLANGAFQLTDRSRVLCILSEGPA
ncbi:pyridoxal-phosphate dependent enzyme [uncultured Litoreibacter sp.]|uniref:pyridoxal-phosphate dependent enzyme n=1 Tax=uncultured Litoreibacter sp. TaxID=1392394 RepID=UPI0026317A22|nr:pyridoxal-phosphate dependent enzyme [uncultured Litoreibacter sp.]